MVQLLEWMEVINLNVESLIKESELELNEKFKELDEVAYQNSKRVLEAFQTHHVSQAHFSSTTGYGYDDLGRDTLEKIFADVLGAEDALVRSQFISGSHALTVALFAFLRPNDLMLSISGTPYDTLHEVIGLTPNNSSLMSFGIRYDQIELINDDFDVDKIINYLRNNKVKLIEIQRSKGYSSRKSLTISKVKNIISKIREVDSDVVIMIDNCYCEFVSTVEPTMVGADIIVGSLIKNLGGGIAPNGAYIAGRHDLVELAAERLTLPGEGREVGPSLGINKAIAQGLFWAPSVVASSLKTAILTSKLLEKIGYEVEPKWDEERADIVQNIIFHNPKDLIKYCQGIQMGSPIDAFALPQPWDMPGYGDQVIMAAGTFTQGSSIELSCDGPMREPYIAYQQGGLTYEYGKLGVLKAVQELMKKDN